VSFADIFSIAALVIAAVSGGSSFYAVVISRRALRWEQQRDQDRSEPKVTIEFAHAAELRDESMRLDIKNANQPRLYYQLTINVVNSGETTEFLKTLWVEPTAGGQGVDYSPRADVELKPHSRWPVPISAANIPDPADGFLAIAHLAHGQEVTSPVEHLIDDLTERVEKHNRALVH
jgi:hypothetical protein